jgi:hypothetical protein
VVTVTRAQRQSSDGNGARWDTVALESVAQPVTCFVCDFKPR